MRIMRLVTVAALACTAGFGCDENEGATVTPASVTDMGVAATSAAVTVMVGSDPTTGIGYSPQTVNISVGQTVTWNWVGSLMHSVTSGTCSSASSCMPDGNFDSGSTLLGPGSTFSHTFTTAGTFPYYCRNHLGLMTGTVIVGMGAQGQQGQAACNAPGATGNSIGVGKYCTPTGGECSGNGQATTCAAGLAPGMTTNFCTKINCLTDADCGDGGAGCRSSTGAACTTGSVCACAPGCLLMTGGGMGGGGGGGMGGGGGGGGTGGGGGY
jgi:plastocyanin